MSTTNEIIRRHRPLAHVDIGLAKLRLKPRYGLEDLWDAESELHRHGFLRDCWVPQHGEDCVIITGKEAK